MTARVLAALVVLAGVAGAARWWWLARCERACANADRDAHTLFNRGEVVAALELIDAVDARCDCSRYTSGDAPPQYALADACLRQLLRDQRSADFRRIASNARGPILRALLRESPEYRALR